MSQHQEDAVFYSLRDQAQAAKVRESSYKLRIDAGDAALQNDALGPQPTVPKPARFVSRAGKPFSKAAVNMAYDRDAEAGNFTTAPNPYLNAERAKRLQQMVEERAKQLK